jgi:hypothetical protein
MKACRILSFTFFTLNTVWKKPRGGGAPTSWLVGPPITDLAPTSYTRCSATSSAIRAPTRTLCALHQSIWLSAQPLTPARRVGCMCVILGIIPNGSWASHACRARAATGWGTISNNDWTKGKKPATSWGWFLSNHFLTDPAQHFFPVASISS